ncbi:MAG: hypothetical protein HDS78_03035 [Bacteroidales bacterium]|nr:hypothetical protein [Bacteroidales bacterium]
MKQRDLDNYYKNLENYLDSGRVHSIPNSDRAHNATIIRFMLDKSDTVNMFCGQMSIFRNKFYDRINEDNDGVLGTYLKNEMVKALTGFINKANSKLNIILERFNIMYFSDLISSSIFKAGVRSGKISLRKSDPRLFVSEGVSHFTYTSSDIARMEIEQEPHSGICTVNLTNDMKDIIGYNYSVLERTSSPLDTNVLL